MFSYQRLNELLDAVDDPRGLEVMDIRYEAVHDYIEHFVDHVPRNDDEAIEAFELATELVPAVLPLRLEGRTTKALIALRRLQQEVSLQPDPCVPPLQREERVLRSLIAWMARPVLLKK